MAKGIFAGIMAGGKGERLWPLSRESRPKQLLNLLSNRTMLEETIDRIAPMIPIENTLIITTSTIVDPIRNLLPQSKVLVEPVGKNTAPACAFAAFYLKQLGFEEGIIFMLPADHVIKDREGLLRTFRFAADIAEKERALVTFGIKPTRPETGYGYIEFSDEIGQREGIRAFKVARFREKPDRETAIEYIKTGRFLWNSGMFVWRVDVFIEALKKYLPEVFELGEKLNLTTEDGVAEFYRLVPEISVDYGVMEKADNIAVVEASFDWEDVGSLFALSRVLDRDEHGNAVHGEVVTLDAENNILYSRDGLVAVIGVKDIIVVHTDDVTIVLPSSEAQRVKEIRRLVANMGLKKYL